MNPKVPELIRPMRDVEMSFFMTEDPKSPRNKELLEEKLLKKIFSGFRSLWIKPAVCSSFKFWRTLKIIVFMSY